MTSTMRVRLLLGAALTGLLLQAAPWQVVAAQHQRHGKQLLVEHRLTESMIGELNRFKPSAPVKGESVLAATMLADTKEWEGPPVDGRMSGNPYTMVVQVKGVAKADGDATSLWQAGWRIVSGKDADQYRLMPLPGIARTGAKAGERVEIWGPPIPTTFKEDRKVAPVIGLVHARNLEIQEVRVQVWSGMESPGLVETLLSFRWALVGVVLVALWWFWLRRD